LWYSAGQAIFLVLFVFDRRELRPDQKQQFVLECLLTQDRRKHPRFKSGHPARLILSDALAEDCRIDNFSRGGFCLAIDGEALQRIRREGGLDARRSVDAVVLLQAETDAQEHRIPVRVVFASDQGVGAVFMHPDQQVLSYLSRASLTNRQHAAATGDTPSTRVLQQIQVQLEQILSNRYAGFIHILTETFLELEDQASQQEQPDLRHGRRAIETGVAALKQRFLEQVAGNWQQLRYAETAADLAMADDKSLELVDQDEFDEWAAVVATSRRLESRLSQTLFRLSQAIAHMLKSPVSNDNNPLSPYSLLWAFKKSLDPLGLSVAARHTAYAVFAEQILATLDPLYHRVYQLLEQNGFAVDEIAVPRVRAAPVAQTEQAPEPQTRPRPRSLIESLSAFIGRPREGGRREGARHVSSNAAVAHALEEMVQADQRNLADRVEQALGGHAGAEGGVELSAEGRQIIDATEQLLRMAQQDPRHNSTMRRILRQIQLPLAKAAIRDPGVLNDPGHASRQLLDNLDQLALLTPSTEESALARGGEEKLQAILLSLEQAGGKADLDQVTQQVSTLLQERRERFNSNLEQVLAASAQERQSVDASCRIRTFLKQELGGSISLLVDQLLHLGWAGLLVQTALAGEEKQKHLQSYQDVLRLLNQALQPDTRHAYLKADKWDKVSLVLNTGFDSYPVYRHQSHALIAQFGECLAQGSENYHPHNERRVDVDEAYLDQLLPASVEPGRLADPASRIDPQWRSQLAEMRIGDWAAEQRSQGHARMLNLALHDEPDNRYLFVDCNGVKALDCTGHEMVLRLQSGQLSLLEDAGLPMVERAVERALRLSFEQLREQSDRDSVTGLMNRRAFRRELERLLKNSLRTHNRHALICIDVDKFSLVNELCGSDGGDQFLANIAGICRSFLDGSHVISRTGDNEFSILLEQIKLEEGFRFAESLRKAIQNYHFQWSGEQVTVTVSIGLAEVNSDSGGAEVLIHAAHSACEEAKHEGRNRCLCYQQEGAVYEEKKRLVQSVPLIEKALEHDQLELFAQLIQPVFAGDGLLDHHEVLLRRMDEHNQPASPEQFIEAAERYERMQAVDRWVVQRFFNWANNELSAETAGYLGGFSINLSGQSMGDESFIPFLKEQIQHSVIAPEKLAFEITETAMVSQLGQVTALMREIRALGCRFFLDDFGTGYASYSYLKEFPVDVVKIDGIFVKDIHQDEVSCAMVKSITEVAHHMGKLVVAEFVHTEAILNVLRRLEVDYAQGFCIGRPGPLKLLSRYKPPV
jgi:diguanylate cyclase (GGDEF)-like protein